MIEQLRAEQRQMRDEMQELRKMLRPFFWDWEVVLELPSALVDMWLECDSRRPEW